MRLLMVMFCAVFSYLSFFNEQRDIFIENTIYDLYINDFEHFLQINDDLILTIDCGEISDYFNNKGYDVIVENIEGEIRLKYKNYKGKEKVYSFYMVRNNEYK